MHLIPKDRVEEALPERITSHSLHKGVQFASRIETRAALNQLVGGKRECKLLEGVPFHQQETAVYLVKQLRAFWLAANNAQLDEVADLLEKAVWKCSQSATKQL